MVHSNPCSLGEIRWEKDCSNLHIDLLDWIGCLLNYTPYSQQCQNYQTMARSNNEQSTKKTAALLKYGSTDILKKSFAKIMKISK